MKATNLKDRKSSFLDRFCSCCAMKTEFEIAVKGFSRSIWVMYALT